MTLKFEFNYSFNLDKSWRNTDIEILHKTKIWISRLSEIKISFQHFVSTKFETDNSNLTGDFSIWQQLYFSPSCKTAEINIGVVSE